MLTILMLLPLIGAVMIAFFSRGDSEKVAGEARYIALFTTLITYAASIVCEWALIQTLRTISSLKSTHGLTA